MVTDRKKDSPVLPMILLNRSQPCHRAGDAGNGNDNPDNPPGNPELLAFLEQELVAARYDQKHLHRLILNSTT